MNMASVEEDFPRGGLQKKTLKDKPLKRHVEHDNLFESHHDEEIEKRKKSKEAKEKSKKQKTGKDSAVLKLNIVESLDILSFKKLTVGTLILGCVKEVTDFELVISLPNGLTGYVQVTNICEAYNKILNEQVEADELLEDMSALSDLYFPGTIVRCAITSLGMTKGGHHSIKLSLNPKDVNKALSAGALRSGMLLSGCVASVEDHGYLIDIGVSGAKAFLPRQKAQDYIKSANRGVELKVGQYLNCLVEEVKNDGRIVRLSVDQSDMVNAYATEEQNWSLSNLLPGLLVKAQIQTVTPHGIVLQFLTSYTGSVDFMHLDPEKTGRYREGQNVKACIMYILPSSRTVGLTLHQSFLQPGTPLSKVSGEHISEVIEECTVRGFHSKAGALFEFSDGTLAFAHKVHLSESKQTFNPGNFTKGKRHSCRIIDYSPMDEVVMVSLKKSIIEAPFLRYHDIQAGQLIEGKVTALERFGMQVKVTDHIRGLVPKMHLSDIILSHPEKKYSVGDEIQCRVLSVIPDKKKLILTRKKTLLESKLPIITSYHDAKPGMVSHGYIVCVKDFGCIVRFYNSVRGLVPRQELSSEPISCPEGVFYVGQAIKAVVLSQNPDQEKMLLSFRSKGGAVPQDGEKEHVSRKNDGEFQYETGKIVEAEVVKKTETGLEVSVSPYKTPAFIPTMHLSDHVTNCHLLWKAFQEGDMISGVMCLSQSKDRIILSKKPALIMSVKDGQLGKHFSEIQSGMILRGYVKNIMPYGVFVEFPYGIVGLAPKAAMSDKFVTNTIDHFVVGQTVVAKVTETDQEKQRVLLTLKVSECSSEDICEESFGLLKQCLQELQEVRSRMASQADSEVIQNLSKLLPGQKLKLTVDEVKEDRTAYFRGDCVAGATVSASHYHLGGKSVVPGEKATVLVLYVDFLTLEVHISLRQELMTAKVKPVKENAQHLAVVQHVAKELAIVSLAETGQLTAIPVASHWNDTFRFDSEKLSVGQSLSVMLKMVNAEDYGVLFAVQGPMKMRSMRREHKQSDSREDTLPSVKHSLCVGDILTATVKSVKTTRVLVSIDSGVVGSIHVSEILDQVSVDTVPALTLKIGQKVTARVIGGREVKTHKFLPITHPHFTMSIPELTLKPSKLQGECTSGLTSQGSSLHSYQAGQAVTCFVSKYNTVKKWLEVDITGDIKGKVELLLMSLNEQNLQHPEKLYKPGQVLAATVIGPGSPETRLNLSLTGVHSLVCGAVVLGAVKKVTPNTGLTLALPFGQTGTASVFDLKDKYLPSPLDKFTVGQIVRCCVISNKDNRIAVSLRQSRVNPDSQIKVKDAEIRSLGDLKKGQLVRGFVKCLGEAGVFIALSQSIMGRVLYQHVTDYFIKDHRILEENIPVGKLVITKVLRVNKKQNQVELSLLPADTGKPDLIPQSLKLPLRHLEETEEQEESKKNKGQQKRKNSENKQEVAPKKKKKKFNFSEEDDSGVDVYCREVEDTEEEPKKLQEKKKKPEAPRLQVPSGFTWDVSLSTLGVAHQEQQQEEESSSDSDDEEESKPKKKKTNKEKEAEKRQMEKDLSKMEAALMDPTRQPQTADDFDRLVLSSPNSSIIWLQYMAFHLHATEIEKARAVAERALKTISFREEQEKLNVWVALLNLENMYGTEETLTKVFERAIQYNDPLKVFQKLADIYTKSDKHKQADELYNTMLKRFRQSKEVWLSYATFLLKRGQTEATHRLLQRALKCLPDKEHVDTIVKFAQLEFRFGDVERAKSIIESTLDNYPKRTDLWSIYIDMMIKHGTQKEVRDIFERVTHLSLAPKRMKFFFKRYLDYEKQHGSKETVRAVKEKALEYVEGKCSLTES